MAVFLTGDTHGSENFEKIRTFDQVAGSLTRDDYLIVLGDFGLLWTNPPSKEELELLSWLEDRPWTTLFLDGNHENFDMLDELPITERFGGRVQYVRDHIIHLMRGEHYKIGGHTFFVCGGGHSIDETWRTPHVGWWPQEVPDEEERAYIARQAEVCEGVDYILTHCPPTGQYERYRARWPRFWGPDDEYTDWLEEHIEGTFPYKRWFFGHLHIELPLDEPYTALFNQVFDLDSTGLTTYGIDMGTCPEGTLHTFEMRFEPPKEGEKYGHAWYECACCGKRATLW